MTRPENQIWARYKDALNKYGLANRIETSTMGGFPDIVYIYDSRTIYIELKQTSTRFIKLESYQIGWHTRAMTHLHSCYDWWWIERKGLISCFTWSRLSKLPMRVTSDGVKIDMGNLEPDCILNNPSDFGKWLELTEDYGYAYR